MSLSAQLRVSCHELRYVLTLTLGSQLVELLRCACHSSSLSASVSLHLCLAVSPLQLTRCIHHNLFTAILSRKACNSKSDERALSVRRVERFRMSSRALREGLSHARNVGSSLLHRAEHTSPRYPF